MLWWSELTARSFDFPAIYLGCREAQTYSECCSATALFCGARIRNMPEEEVIQHNWRICHALCCQYNGIEWIESKWMCMFFPVVLCAMQLVKYGQVLKGAWLPKWMVGWRGVPTFVEAHDSICGSFGFMKVSHDLTAHQKKVSINGRTPQCTVDKGNSF